MELKPTMWHKMCDLLTHLLTELEMSVNTCIAFATKNFIFFLTRCFSRRASSWPPCRSITMFDVWRTSRCGARTCPQCICLWTSPKWPAGQGGGRGVPELGAIGNILTGSLATCYMVVWARLFREKVMAATMNIVGFVLLHHPGDRRPEEREAGHVSKDHRDRRAVTGVIWTFFTPV